MSLTGDSGASQNNSNNEKGFFWFRTVCYEGGDDEGANDQVESVKQDEELEDVEDLDWYYAVAVGRCAGIFTDMDDAMMHTRGYSYAKFKKFPTFDEARGFLNHHNLDVGRCHSFTDGSRRWFAYDVDGGNNDDFPDPKHPNTLVAFCDGSALRNGLRDCDAAYACIFPHNRDWDVVESVDGPWATSNRAEFLGALAALERANQEDSAGTKMLYIFSDSKGY